MKLKFKIFNKSEYTIILKFNKVEFFNFYFIVEIICMKNNKYNQISDDYNQYGCTHWKNIIVFIVIHRIILPILFYYISNDNV